MELKRTTEIFIILCPLKIKVNQLCTSSLSYLHLKKKKIRERRVTFTISLPSPFFILLVPSYAISLHNIKCICKQKHLHLSKSTDWSYWYRHRSDNFWRKSSMILAKTPRFRQRRRREGQSSAGVLPQLFQLYSIKYTSNYATAAKPRRIS